MKNHFIIYFTLILLFSCQKKAVHSLETNVGSFQNYISGIQAGHILQEEGVKIFFNQSPIPVEKIGEELNPDLISISPTIKGKWIWENAYTIGFKSDLTEMQNPQTVYKVKLKMNQLFTEIPDSLNTLEFDFSFLPVQSQVNWKFLKSDPTNPNFMYIEAFVKFSDFVDSTTRINYLQIDEPNKHQIKFEVEQNLDGYWKYKFYNIERTQIEQKLSFSWDIDFSDQQKMESHSIKIPSISDFVITGVETEEMDERLVQIYFSDPLDQLQDLKSFVKLKPAQALSEIRSDQDVLYLRISNAEEDAAISVTLLPGIKSSNGKISKSEFQYDVLGKKQKPKVRILSSGNILPFSDQLVLPFEAINLKKVDIEIFKIFSNNVLFNLHMDYGNDSYNMVKMGRIVHQQTIELDAKQSGDNKRVWRTYGLELSKMITPEPGALYDVRISFKPEYSDYDCAKALTNLKSSEYGDLSGNSKYTSFWNQWGYYEYGDEDGTPCFEAEDPCCPYYYSSRKFARRLIMASNIGLIVKKSPEFDAHYIFVRDLMTGKEISGAEIKLYDGQLQCVYTGKSDGTGKLIHRSLSEIGIVMAKYKEHYAYLKLDQGRNLPLSEFDVNGVSSQQGLKIFNYAERGIWRPGDTILFGTILYQADQKIPSQLPLQVLLKNPNGKTVFQEGIHQNHFGHYSIKIPTRPDFITGDYTIEVKSGTVVSTKILKIETVKPNRYKVEYNADLIWEPSDEWPVMIAKASFLHGAPASGKKITVDMIYNSEMPEFKDFKSFQFFDPEQGTQAGVEKVADLDLDEKGMANFKYSIDRTQFRNDLNVVLETKIIEEGEVSTDYFEHKVKMHKHYLGIKFVSAEFGNYFPVEKPVQMEAAFVDHNGKAMPNEKLNMEVFLVDGNWWYEVRNNHYFVSEDQKKKLLQSSQITTDSKGLAKMNFTPKEYERYYVRLSSTKTKHSAGLNFYSGWDYGDDDESRQSEYIQVLKLETEKEKYLPGENAKISLPGAQKGNYLINLIKDNKILKTETIPAQKSKTDFSFAITEGMEPNVYLDISLIQPIAGQNSDLPIRMFGVVPVKVENVNRRLEPIIQTADVYKPGQKVEIEVSEKMGKEMAYQLFLVEDGLLGLTRFKTPDPYAWFFQKESMNLYTWDNYSQVIGSANGIFQGVYSIGGDQGIDPTQLAKMKRFKALALTTNVVSLKSKSKNKHTFELPNYNGSVRVMLVANHATAFGSAEKTVPVKSELLSDILFPRVMAIHDEISVPVSITVTDEKIKEVKVTVNTPQILKLVGPTTQSIRFDKPGEKKVFFKLSSKGIIGPAELSINASSANFTANSKVEFFVDNPNPIAHQVKEFWIEPGQTQQEVIGSFGSQGTRQNSISVSVFPGRSVEDMRKELIHYPHGCAEQTSSIAFGQLYLDQIIELDAQSKSEISRNVTAAIQKLSGFQKTNGGFSYWQHESDPSDYVSSYIGHFLLEAKRLGYQVSMDLVNNWKAYQLRTSRNYEIKKSDYGVYLEYNQAYRLYTLALASAPDWTGMNQMLQLKDRGLSSQWLLAGAYALSGKKEIAEGLIKNLSDQIKPYHESYYHYGSDVRDEAVIAMVLNDLNKKSEAGRLINKVFKKLKSNYFMSTQEMAFVLLSCGKIYQRTKGSGNMIKFNYKWNDMDKTIQSEYSNYTSTLTDASKSNWFFSNQSQIPLSVQILQYGKSDDQKIVNESNVLQMTVNYLDEFGKSINLNQINQADKIIANIQISHNGSAGYLRNLALTAAFPSCFEINNQRIGNLNPVNPRVKNTDFRDDRVYYYFDLGIRESLNLKVPLIANSVGQFMAPDFFVEAMYEPSIYARVNKGRVGVIAGK